MPLPAVPPRDPTVRQRRILRRGRWAVLGVLLMAVFVAAGRARLGLPAVPLSDEDVWGYLYPPLAKLTGAGFDHSLSREWPYPAFLLFNLFVFNSFTAVSHFQHILGLLAGGFLLAAWRELTLLPRPARTFAGREAAAWAAGLMGVGLAVVFLLSRRTILTEHTLRPEAVFPCVGALHLWLLLGFVRQQWGGQGMRERRPGAWRWGAAALFVACLLILLRPAFAFAAVFTSLPMGLALLDRRETWRGRLRLAGVPLALAALLLFVPERRLASKDRVAVILMPMMRLAVHGDLVRAQLAADLARPEGPPRHERAWLERFKARFDHCFEASAQPQHRWPHVGFNPDYMVAVEPFAQGLFATDRAGDRALAAFCGYYYFRTLQKQPWAMTRKVGRELTHVYRFTHKDLRKRMLRHTLDPYSQQERVPLTADPYYPRTVRSLDPPMPHLQERGARSDAFRRYLDRARALAAGGATRKLAQPKAVGITENLVRATYLPVMLLALGLAAAVAFRPAWRASLSRPAGAVALLFLYNFGMCLTVAIVQTLSNPRYVEAQAVFTLFAWAAGVWWIGTWAGGAMAGRSKSRGDL